MLKKKVKYTRMYLGNLPETRKERDKLYRFLEGAKIMQKIFSGSEVLIKEK